MGLDLQQSEKMMQNIQFLESYPKMTRKKTTTTANFKGGYSVAPLEVKEHYSGKKKKASEMKK